MFLLGSGAVAQVNVLTQHNDIARTGQNLQETILTPSNVNPTQFGKLFSQPVNGEIYAQPLYVSNVAIPGNGTHNVVYVATTSGNPNGTYGQYTGDSVYAFDADTNGGVNANPLWQVSLLTNSSPAGTYTPAVGVVGTPVIDPISQTMYLVSSEVQSSVEVTRLHALDITTGAEKFGGPVQIQGSIPGTGVGSVGGVLAFNPAYHTERSGLLLLNGVVYAGFGSYEDQGPWHGWIFSYNAATLQQIDVICTTPNGSGGGIWAGGEGLAAEVYSAAKPYGRMFVATANGSYGINSPTISGQTYSNPTNSYGMSVLDLDLTLGQMTIEDEFTPYNEALLNAQDGDLGSGGPILVPTQTLASGKILNPLVEVGKSGTIYYLDRDNSSDGSNNPNTEYNPAGLGGFNAAGDQIVQEVQTPLTPGFNWGAGVWGTEAYWNNNIYFGGTNPVNSNNYNGTGNGLSAYPIVNGALSATPSSQSTDLYTFPGPTPSISSNGATNGIVWALHNSLNGPVALSAYDATNLANLLYSSTVNFSRDNAGTPTEFAVPTIANGKVYVGAVPELSVFGLLGVTPTAPAPVISPSSGPVVYPQTVTITDAIANATIYYTTDGSTPNSNSPVYQNPFVVTSNQTITAVASPTGYLASAPASVTYAPTGTPANPVFSLSGGTYSGAQTLTITESTPGAAIYYTVDGPVPSTASAVYTQPLSVPASETVQAIAVAASGFASGVVSATYAIHTIDFSQGFALADGPMQFNGTTGLDDFRLQLTDGGMSEAGSAFFATPVNIQSFTTDFTFQLSNPSADGITFTIQNVGATALGADGGSLGYGGIGKSVAIKFDLYSNQGEGVDSTGVYTNGASPTLPAINLSSTGINLHSGDYIDAHLTYDGTNLNLTLIDEITLASWSQTFAINIPAIVGGNTAYVGFTGGTGGLTASQKIASWTYLAGPPAPNYSAGFNAIGLTLNGGATLNGIRLRVTDTNPNEARSAFFTSRVNVQQFSTHFQFQLTYPNADGFTFTIQGVGPTALGRTGGALGYTGIASSVAIKFDLYSNGGEGPDSTGLYTNGANPTLPAINLSSTGINLHSGDIFNVQMTYNGATLTVVITDTVTNASATQAYTVNIPAIIGATTGYVGFTGGTGGATAIQEILNWVYYPIPAPQPAFFNGSPITLNGGAAMIENSLGLTDGNPNEARSAFSTAPVNVQQFSTSFGFQLTNPNADGFTFTIQGVGPTALGNNGGSLGYGGIPESVAVKFDLYSNQGEGPDSTGLYTDGANPMLPAIDLSSTGIDLHSGDIFNAQLNYNGTTLTVVITDTVTNASATQSYAVNIPSIIGGTTGYVGFTGGSGGLTAIQDILNWNYTSGSAN